MKYKAAFNIGSQIEGTIQCTYATIFDATGRALFSIQSKVSNKLMAAITQTGDRESMEMYFDFPMVVADGYSADRLVPATLTYEAQDLIYQYVNNASGTKKKYLLSVWEQVKNKTIYVKPAAFSWYPLNIENLEVVETETGTIEDLTAELQAAERKMKSARALLLAAGVSTVIL